MNQAKVQFSSSEMELMRNSEIILTKNKVLGKVKTLLEELQNNLTENNQYHSETLSTEFFSIHPKISKGENCLGLPYLILDYPRLFKQQDIFATRTMFWWGNFYSTTLHLSGEYKLKYLRKIQSAQNLLSRENFSIGINEDPWLHDFTHDNYRLISSLNEEEFKNLCEEQQHLKIAKTIALNDDNVNQKLMENWQLLAKICFG